MEIDFDAGIANAISAQRQITTELRAQASELQKLERAAGRLQPRLATVADIAKLGGPRFGQTPRAATQADLSRLLGIRMPGGKSLSEAFANAKAADARAGFNRATVEAAARGEVPVTSSMLGGRTGGIAARAGISDADAQRVFNARLERATDKWWAGVRARARGTDAFAGFGAGKAKGMLSGLRALSRGSISMGSLKNFGGNAAMLAAATGDPVGGVIGAGLHKVISSPTLGPVAAGVAYGKFILDKAAAAWQSGRDIAHELDRPLKTIHEIYKKELKDIPGERRLVDTLSKLKYGDPVKSRNVIGDFFHWLNPDSRGAEIFSYEDTWETAKRDARRKEKLLNNMRQQWAENPEIMSEVLRGFYGNISKGDAASVAKAMIEGLNSGQISLEDAEAISRLTEREADRRNKPLTTKQQQDMREMKNRANAWDKFNAMQKQEWNPV